MNILKPRKSVLNAKALVYRRVTRIEKSRITSLVYMCLKSDSTYDYYMYDADLDTMISVDVDNLEINPTLIPINNDLIVLTSGTKYFYWDKTADSNNGAWVEDTTIPQSYSTLLDAGYSSVGRYHTNQYYYVGAIDYLITGEVAGAETQPIKGAIMPLSSMNIKYYDDYINLGVEDLIVIDHALYSVENADYSIKHQPRQYKVYYATLNSVL